MMDLRDEIEEARAVLTSFAMSTARTCADQLGFGWRASGHAPTRYELLKLEFSFCKLTGAPLRVSNEHCENTIFLSPLANCAFRFWHDMTHIRLDRTFEALDEIVVAHEHLRELQIAGFGPHTMEYRLLSADSHGQTYCLRTIGRFPINQLQFDTWCVTDGLEKAVAREAMIR
jgi:hypothetical protein